MGPEEKSITERLNAIASDGIQTDRIHLKQNMCTQFSDPFEFAREYVVNSYDAGATDCYISGRETRSTVTVTIRDNGSGMDMNRLMDYFKIFRSRKDDNGIKAVGHFGVGKLSVAAVPGLIKFAGITSTGNECWRFQTDSLLEDKPVLLERIEPVAERGTKFEITFRKEKPLNELLAKIYKILYQYVRYLNITIWFDMPVLDKDMNPIREKLANDNWLFNNNCLGKRYVIHAGETPVEVIMGVGEAEHEIYQNKVFITSKYNLLIFTREKAPVANLKIRVNSEVFRLTFGRHCLSDESVLYGISEEISLKLMPDYFLYLRSLINEDFVLKYPDMVPKIEEMACGLIEHSRGNNPWCNFRMFRVHGQHRLSFIEISDQVRKGGVIYCEAGGNEGTDYSMFDVPVLMSEQPQGAIELLMRIFKSQFVNLNEADVVIEAPAGLCIPLSPEEKRFESFLEFKPKEEVINKLSDIAQKERKINAGLSGKNLDAAGICEEARIAGNDFNSIRWKVNFLVERDGITPCRSRRFLYIDLKIILNLYHPDVRQLVSLSLTDPGLSAHWALAMCISDMKLLPHITPETREDLLIIDAMSRLNGSFAINTVIPDKKRNSLIDFIRGLS